MQTINVGKKPIVYATVTVVAVVSLFFLFSSSGVQRQLNDWKLLPQPERLTELYYRNHAKLPTVYDVGSAQQFSFVTHNLEFQPSDYKYTVTARSETGQSLGLLASGNFSLEHDDVRTTTIKFTPVDYGQKIQIVTTLTNNTSKTDQKVHYWATRKS